MWPIYVRMYAHSHVSALLFTSLATNWQERGRARASQRGGEGESAPGECERIIYCEKSGAQQSQSHLLAAR